MLIANGCLGQKKSRCGVALHAVGGELGEGRGWVVGVGRLGLAEADSHDAVRNSRNEVPCIAFNFDSLTH